MVTKPFVASKDRSRAHQVQAKVTRCTRWFTIGTEPQKLSRMPSESFSVIVDPNRWQRSTEELARTLSPLMGVSPPVLSSLLLRGPMTVEADLSHSAAMTLCSKLVGAGVPAIIEGAGDETVSDHINVSDIEKMLNAMGIDAIEVDDELELMPRTAPFEPLEPRPVAVQEVDSGPTTEPGWQSLFPDITTNPVPLFDEGETEEETPRNKAPLMSLSSDVMDDLPPEPEVRIEPPKRPEPPQSMGALLEKAEESRPPFAPTGFDDRAPHIPKLARLLSVLAPGAGQVYNGDDEVAIDFALNAWKLKPWADSVRHAERRAERVQTYWLAWPKPGNVFRALKFVAAYWLVLGAIFALGFFVVRAGLAVVDREPIETLTEQDREFAFSNAKGKVLEARVAALDALSDSIANAQHERFTMTDDERAERLYLTGYQDCVARRFDVCEAAMRKVTALDPANRNAFRLQTWANAQRMNPDGTKMPDVGEVPTLEDFEMEQLEEEVQP